MAKSQKRSNGENRKPKSDKPATPVAATSFLARAASTPIITPHPKKKG